MTRAVRRAAVLGHPVAHSLSPVLHRAAYGALGLDGWSYGLEDVTEAGLPAYLAGRDASWAGLSLTMPLKRAVIPLLDRVSPLALAVGAVNTVTWPDGAAPSGGVGDNTDVHGLVAALHEAGVHEVGRATVLGGGATAASAVAAVLQLGCVEPVLAVRDAGRAADALEAGRRVGARPGTAPLDRVWSTLLDGDRAPDVVVSTVPAGGSEPLVAALERSLADGPAAGAGRPVLPVLVDVVYAPWPTPLARAWRALGGRAVGGLAMLLHQAGEQVRLMTGLEPPIEVMREAGEAELARRAAGAGV